MSDLNRKQFEEWFDESGFYKFKETAWAAWEASREGLVIELPGSIEAYGPNGYHSSDADEALIPEDVQAALTAAGVKYK